jgi:DNA-binding NarL/FixJ family response regulator
VQESLTNTLKHAGAKRASVTLRWNEDTVELEVVDDGDGGNGLDVPSGGRGLIGMRERVIVLTTFDLDEHVQAALRAGASGFLVKDGPAAEMLTAVRVVAAGESLLSPSVTRRVIAELVSRPEPSERRPPALDELTPREEEVLRLLARGRSNAEIADELVVSHETVKSHVARILMKLGARDRVQAVIAAYEAGLVRPGED